MKLIIFGSTGGAGRQIVTQALEKGVLYRESEKFTIEQPTVTIIGDL